MKNNNGFILLIEDNPGDEFLTIKSLRECNIKDKIVVVRDGEEALNFLFGKGKYQGRDETQIPLITLLDLNLPKIGGLEVMKEIRKNKNTKSMPVIIFTSSKHEQDIINSYEFGANSYIRKPVDFEQFTKAIQNLGLYSLVLNEYPKP